MKRTVLLATLALAAIAASVPAQATTRTEAYIAGSVGDVAGFCAENNPAEVNVGAVCVQMGGGRTVSIRANDLTGLSVGFYYEFQNSAGNCVGTSGDPLDDCTHNGFTCGSISNLASPSGTAEVVVILDGPAFGPLDCLLDGPGDSPGAATNGTVTVTF